MIKRIAFTVQPIVDVARAREFYEGALGLEVGTVGSHGEIHWVEYDLPGGGCLALTNAGPTKPSAEAGATVALEVADLDGAIGRLKEQGVRFEGDVIHGPRCRMAVCLDPDGNSILLHQLDADHREPDHSM